MLLEGFKMNDTRQFLIDDISALLNQNQSHEWLEGVNDNALYALWKDLLNLTTMENHNHV
jgi:hypothetical protein